MNNAKQQKDKQIEQALSRMLKGTVPVISTDKLAESLTATSDWLVLDSREYSEFKLSHLPNAKWVGFTDFSESRVMEISPDRKIAVYCSIGVRSELIAEKLMLLGFTRVFNLYGGIFTWANQGRSLVDHNLQSTEFVHGYDKKWSKLVVNPDGDF